MKNKIDVIKIKKMQSNNILKILSNRNNKIVFNINNKYVLKKCDKNILLSQMLFYQVYKMEGIYEQIIKFNYYKSYIICKYESNNDFNYEKNIDKMLYDMKKIISKYKIFNNNGYGDVLNFKKTWSEFLREEVKRNSEYFKLDKFEEKKLNDSLHKIKFYNFLPKLIHGDLGCYNIIFNNEKIKKIIDARAIVGDPQYDFIFYIFSSSKLIRQIDLKRIFFELSNEPVEKIKALNKIILYNRICALNKNNIQTKEYMRLWKEMMNYE